MFILSEYVVQLDTRIEITQTQSFMLLTQELYIQKHEKQKKSVMSHFTVKHARRIFSLLQNIL